MSDKHAVPLQTFVVTKTRTWTQTVRATDADNAVYMAEREHPERFEELEEPAYNAEHTENGDGEPGWGWFTRGDGFTVPQVCDDWNAGSGDHWNDDLLDKYLMSRLTRSQERDYLRMLAALCHRGTRMSPEAFNAKFHAKLEPLLRDVHLPAVPPKVSDA